MYFLTFCTYRKQQCLHTKGVPELLIEDLKFYSRKIEKLIAYTVMPDHIHLLIEVGHEEEMKMFLRDFKKHTAHTVRELIALGDSHLWQYGSMDHRIRTTWGNADFINHFHYLFYNSVKHLGIAPKNFPYHDFLEHVQRGTIDIDFCGFEEKRLPSNVLYEYSS